MLKLVKNPPLVDISNLSKHFGPVTALNKINFKIPQGHIVGLLGPNGSGKTTLIKVLAGLYTNFDGHVLIDGHKPCHETKAFVSYQGDQNCFPSYMEVNEAIAIYRTFFADFDEVLCNTMLDSFDINSKDKLHHMSKGATDKLQIALTMSRKAKLYLLDEPLGGVDVKGRDKVLEAILNSFNPEGTIIIATHLISQIEAIFDKVIFLDKGNLTCFGDCDDIRQKNGLSLEESICIS